MPVPATDEEEAPAPPPNARVPVDPAQEGDGDNQVAAPVGAKLPAPLGLIAHPAAVQEEDPRIRRYKAMQAVQTKLKSDFEQDHPFAPSGSYDATRNAEPEIRTGRSLARDSSGRIHVRDDTERVLTGALKDSDAQAKEKEIADRRAALEAKRVRNDPRRAQAASTGQRTRVDEWGETQAVLDPDGKPLYHVGQWEEGLHPDTKLPVLQRRGHHGEVETKHPLISASPNLSDPGAYYKAQDGEYKPYGDKSLEELKNHPDFGVARMAYRATTARNAAIHKEALAGMYQEMQGAQRDYEQAGAQYTSLAQRAASQKALVEGETDPIKQAGLQASLDETNEQMADLQAQTRPQSKTEAGGALWLAQRQAVLHYHVAQHDQRLQSYKDSAAEIQARAKAGQPLPGDDERLAGINQQMAAHANVRGKISGLAEQDRQGAPPQPPAPPQSKQDESLTQSEPATLFAKGVKNIGEVSVQELARRYGSGTGEVQPASLLKISQRSKDIDETLKASGTNISPELSKSLTAEKTYLGRLYAQRFARLAPDVQKRVADATREPTNWEIAKANMGNFAEQAGTTSADIIQGLSKTIARAGALTQPGGAAMMLSGIDNPVVEKIDQYAKWEKNAIAESNTPQNEAEAKAKGSTSAQISGAVGGFIPYALPVARVARLGVAAEAAITGAAGALGIGQSFRDEATRGLQDQLDAGKITKEQFHAGQNQAEGIGTVIGAGMMLPFSGFARAMARTPVGRTLVSTIVGKIGKDGEASAIKWLGGKEAEGIFRRIMVGGAGGATTGFGQAVATNMAARGDFGNVAYDEKRGLFEGAGEGGAALGLLGAIHSAMLKGEGRVPGVPEGKEPKAGGPKETPAKSKGELAEEAEKAAAPAEKAAPARDIVQEPTTPAQKSALAIHQGLKEAEALRSAPEGGKLLKAQLGKESKGAPADELKAVAQARAEQEPPPSTETKPTELAAVGKAGEAASAERAGREIAGAGVSPEARGRAEIAAREAAPVNIGPRDETVSTGTGVPTAKEKTMLAEQQRLVDEHLAQNKAGGAAPIVKAMVGAAQESAAGIRKRISDVKIAPIENGKDTFTFTLDGKPHKGVLAGRNKNLVIGANAEADKAIATRALLDGDANPTTEKPTHALPVEKSGPLSLQSAPENRKGVRQENPVDQGAAGAQAVRPEGKGAVSEAVAVTKPKTAEPPPKAEPAPIATEKEPTPPAQMKPAERVAELQAAGIKEVNGKPLTGPESANAAEIINAVGKLRKGKPDLAEPAQKRLSDRAIEALQKAKLQKPGQVFAHTPFSLAYDGALDVAILGIRAGRAVADVVKSAIDHFKEKYPQASAFALKRLEHDIMEAHATAAKEVVAEPVKETPVAKSKGLASKIGDAWSKLKDENQLKQAIAANRDAVEGKANLYAAESKNEIADALRRAEPDEKLRKTADDALRFYIEVGDGNAEQLNAMRAKVETSAKATPKWKEKSLAAIDYAAANGEKLKDSATRYRRIMGEQLNAEQDAGLPTLEEKNYVPRHQDVEDGSWLEPKSGSGGTAAGNRKNRSFDTTADSVAAGIDPKTLSATDSMTARVKAGMTGVHLRSWQKSLYDLKDPTTKEAVAVKPERIERADGSVYYQPPKGYDLESVGNAPVAVKKEYSGLVSALTDPSWWGRNKATVLAQKANANAKALTLAVDTFHLGRLAFRSAMINASHPQGFKVGPTYQKGLLLADHSPAEITRMAEAGGIPKENLDKYLSDKKTLDGLVGVGYNIGQVSDAMHQEMIQSMPVLGTINKFIFQKFQRGAMTDAGILEYNRQRADYPKLTDDQVARKVSRELMTRFGNLGRQGLFKSKGWQDTVRMLFLAPQWNEGLIRSEIGGAKQIGQGVLNLAQGKKAAMGLLGREMLATGISLFTASQLINQVTRGKFTWENPEEGWGAKLSAWIPDKLGGSSGFFLNPMGLTAETAHLLLNSFERAGNTYDPLIGYLRSRASAATRPLWTFVTGQSVLGQTLKPSERWEKTAEDAIPAPISGGSAVRVAKGLVSGGTTEKFPGEFQKQAMQSFGVRTEKSPSPEQRIYALARKFNEAHGKEKHATGEVSDYKELTDSVRRGNEGNIKDAIDTLLEKRSAEDLEKYYRLWQSHTFTGSHKNEAAFILTLTPEQKQQYMKARAERMKVGGHALKAIQSIPAGKRAGPFAPALVP